MVRAAKLTYRIGLLCWAIPRFDVFIFGGEQSFLRQQRDLPVLRLLGKRVIWIFTGSDHRPPYLSGRMIREIPDDNELASRSAAVRARAQRIERHATVVAHPASAQYHSHPFVRFLAIGIPAWRDNLPPTADSNGWATVVHSPSDPAAKGTPLIRQIVAEVSAGQPGMRYVELTGRPNRDVLAAIASADLVIDEVYSDTPMAVFATEAALLGRPALVGGYYADEMLYDHPGEEIPPSFYVPPTDLLRTLQQIVDEPALAVEMGRRASAFVHDRWAPASVAKRLLVLANGESPTEWWTDPEGLRYVGGWGISNERLRLRLRSFIASVGPSALGLDHNPPLRERLMAFALGQSEEEEVHDRRP